jgi:hypothetical protein
VPRYFFHVRDSGEFIDREGVVLAGPDEARSRAVVASGEMLKDLGGRFWNDAEWLMWVTDERGATVCALRFSAQSAESVRAGPDG